MSVNQKVSNALLGSYVVEAEEQPDGSKRQVVKIAELPAGGIAGTQYDTGGTVPATPTGTALQFDDSGTWAHVSAANPLPIAGTFSVGATTIASTNNGSGTATSTSSTLVAANANRVGGVQLYNSSTTITIHYKEGATATSSNMPLRPGERVTTLEGYKGVIDIIRGGGSNATVFYIEGSS